MLTGCDVISLDFPASWIRFSWNIFYDMRYNIDLSFHNNRAIIMNVLHETFMEAYIFTQLHVERNFPLGNKFYA